MEKADQLSESEVEKGPSVPGLDPTNVPDDDDRAGITNNDLWICEVCGREFKSKKSLGNHMRVHAHLQNSKSSKKPATTLKIEEPRSCRVCDKQFASQRSLWGHMRCHSNKALKSDAEREANEQDAVYALMMLATGDEEEEEGSLRKRKRKREEDGEYEMAEKRGHVCKQTKFESGQALGGHQRCHWRGSYGSSSSSVAAEGGGEGSGGGRSSDEGKRVVFDFDLNELPPKEDGDGDQPAEM